MKGVERFRIDVAAVSFAENRTTIDYAPAAITG